MIAFVGYCPVCCRDEKTLNAFFCLACLRQKKAPQQLLTMTYEEAPERLIEIIQSRKLPREDREAAMTELISRFRYLIHKNVKLLFNKYNLERKYGWDYADFMQEGLLEFMDLVCNDFKIKKSQGEKELAVFGSYIKVKFYRRLQYRTEEKIKRNYNFGKFISADITSAIDDMSTSGFAGEIREAIAANCFDFTEDLVNQINDEYLREILKELVEISHELVTRKKIEQRDQRIWELHLGSGLNVNDITEEFSSKTSEGKIKRIRIIQIAEKTNAAILAEYGRRKAMRDAGI